MPIPRPKPSHRCARAMSRQMSNTQESRPARQSWLQRSLVGWRPGILRGSIAALVVFIINLTLTILAGKVSKSLIKGQKVVFQGNCNQVKQLDIGIHLIINLLSTVLLAASNYAMQCLSAPTRQDVDTAHKGRFWVDIGVISMRNL